MVVVRVAVAVPNKATVVFTPSGLRGEFSVGTSVLQAAQKLGVDLESSCGGRGQCGRCQVMLAVGEFPKHGISSRIEHITPAIVKVTNTEVAIKPGHRLGCASRILGDMVIDIPTDSQVYQQHIAKDATDYSIEHDPAIQLISLQISKPDIQESESDFRRLHKVLEQNISVQNLACDLSVLQKLQPALKKGDQEVTVAMYHSSTERTEIIAVYPGLKERVYGLAVDLGSTTIAAHLCDLSNGHVIATSALMNPQIRFGEDLMSRVSYVMLNEGGDREMTRVVREAFCELARDAAAKAKIALQDILELTIVCNPIMHHLLLGIDPTPLGSAPFNLATDRAISIKANELDLNINTQARAFILPCLAGHIGADTAGVILAERPDLANEITLLVDVGTNAEIVLGNQHRLLAASSPTGPAFEGAQISCGQRAGPGAVERVRIDRESLEPKYKVIGCDLWSDDPEFSKQLGDIGVSGICGSGIIELVAELFLAGVITSNGVIDPRMASKSARIVQHGRTFAYVLHQGPRVLRITQNDVRAIQLAKAALYAGIRLLMDHMGVDKVERISLAGAFGSHIDVKYAMALGLIPDCDLQHVNSVGNAAGTGARIALLNRSKRDEIESILRRVEKIETAVEAKFQDHFVEAMALPHRTDHFPELCKTLQLPKRGENLSLEAERTPRGRRSKRGQQKTASSE